MNKQIEQKWTSVYPVFTCDVCGKKIEGGQQGYVQIDERDVHYAGERQRIAKDDRESRALKLHGDSSGLMGQLMTASDLLAYSNQLAEWRACHKRCDDMPDDTYSLRIDEHFGTFEDVLRTNFHLDGKNWIQYTDWSQFLQRQLAPYDG